MRTWLTDTASLTMKLVGACTHFRVRRLRQGCSMPVMDEMKIIGLRRRMRVQEREVLLECDGVPVVYAHTIVPLDATASDWPFFGALGEKSLGTTLFGDPKVGRGALQFACLQPSHPLARRAAQGLGMKAFEAPLHARRCLYSRRRGLLLVTEIFLPAIADVDRNAGKAERTE
jgi:chorismate--pyruvate lyase